MNGKSYNKLAIAELSALYEISSILSLRSKEEILKEAEEKAIRLFGVRYYLLFDRKSGNNKVISSWGFQRSEDFSLKINQKKPNQFHFTFTKLGNLELFMEQSYPITSREHRLYTMFAQSLENALLSVKNIEKREIAEKILKTSEIKYRTIFEHTGTATVIIEEDTTLSLVNTEFEILSGYSKEELENKKKWTDFVVKEDLERMKNYHALRRTKAGIAPLNYEFRFIDRDNNIKNVLLTVVLFPDSKKSLASLINITDRKQNELKIKEQFNFLQHLIDSTPLPIFYKDINGVYEGCNKAFEEYLGLTKENIIGKTVYEIAPKELADKYYQKDNELFQKPGFQLYEAPVKYADGTTHIVVFNKTTYHDTTGNLAGLIGIMMDISERKKAENGLRHANRALRAISNSHEIMVRATTDSELMVGICRVIVETEGYRFAWIGFAEHDEQKTVRPVASAGFEEGYLKKTHVSWDDNEQGQGPGGTAIRTRLPVACRDIATDTTFVPWRAEAEKRGFASVLALPLLMDGQVYGVLGIYAIEVNAFDTEEVKLLEELAHDLTFGLQALHSRRERQRVEEALRESEEKFRQMAENIKEAMYIIDPKMKSIIYINPDYEKIWGRSRESLYNNPKSWIDSIHPDDREKVVTHVFTNDQNINVTNNPGIEYRIIRPDGTERWIFGHGFPVMNAEGEPYRVAGIAMDITQLKNTEKKLKKSLTEKEMLLKEIHHRVKNNLMVISSLLNLQSNYIKDKEALDIFKESQNRAKSMALIHERLYKSSDLKRIDFGDYIQTLATDLFHTYVQDPNRVKLNMKVENVMVDINTTVPLGLIVNELVTNSMKHGFEDGRKGEINIDFHKEGDEFTLIVGDTGVGFPEDLDFRNTDSLGLQLVNNLTSQIDGQIGLDRTNGTEFKITFKELEYNKS